MKSKTVIHTGTTSSGDMVEGESLINNGIIIDDCGVCHNVIPSSVDFYVLIDNGNYITRLNSTELAEDLMNKQRQFGLIQKAIDFGCKTAEEIKEHIKRTKGIDIEIGAKALKNRLKR